MRLDELATQIKDGPGWRWVGSVAHIAAGLISVDGLGGHARIGDQAVVRRADGQPIYGEIIEIRPDASIVMPYASVEDIALGAPVQLRPGANVLRPSDAWIGRVIDPFGQPLDGSPLLSGRQDRALQTVPPPAADRAGLGQRLNTGFAALNTFLPVVAGQRVGLFAGSGVGKSNMLAALCKNMDADVIVVAMIGERGRELRQFIDDTLGPDGMARSIIVAATSDQSPLIRRRCAWAAMTVAEHFRDLGQRVLLIADSVTRFAEAHRDVALATGELPALRGYPPSTAQMIMSLCERAGPGAKGQGSITGIFSVLVAGSDFDEPIADILRGVLDGHIILDRSIAERGRYPAINLSKSVSRSLPGAASSDENTMLQEARTLLGVYEQSETMIKAGLYSDGTDPQLDRAMRVWPDLDAFIGKESEPDIAASFDRLNLILRRSGAAG